MEKKKKRVVFKDEKLETQFEKDGYLVIRDFLPEKKIVKMLDVYQKIYQPPGFSTNIWNPLMHSSDTDKRFVSETLLELMLPHIEFVLTDYYNNFYAYFLIKPLDNVTTEVPMHCDASAVNEEDFEYIAIWIPLINVNKHNGCVYIIPGTNKLFTYEQPFATPWPYLNLSKLLKKYAIDLPMNAGDLLIFSGKTIHGSYVNKSNEARPVTATAIIHKEAQVMFNYHKEDENLVKSYEVDPWFYFRNDFSDPIGKYPIKKEYIFSPPKINEEHVKKFFKQRGIRTQELSNFFRQLNITS